MCMQPCSRAPISTHVETLLHLPPSGFATYLRVHPATHPPISNPCLLQVGMVANTAGVGGGAIFVPLFQALVGFPLKPSTALSQVGGHNSSSSCKESCMCSSKCGFEQKQQAACCGNSCNTGSLLMVRRPLCRRVVLATDPPLWQSMFAPRGTHRTLTLMINLHAACAQALITAGAAVSLALQVFGASPVEPSKPLIDFSLVLLLLPVLLVGV